LNVLGGYVPSVNTYAGAAMVIIPHVLGPYDQFDRKSITEFHYHSQALRYPDIRLVYWAGGNPFHHHQDINRLRAAFRRLETIIVHETPGLRPPVMRTSFYLQPPHSNVTILARETVTN
jgi:anaerobic selenocysteine-containing dehydrogenase